MSILHAFRSWNLRYVLVWVILFASAQQAHAQQFCTFGSGNGSCNECYCVGEWCCEAVLYTEVCDNDERCINIRWLRHDGPEDCPYLCCEEYEWECMTE